jgi:5-methyltetrahydrofolate--homocysteine methyltransferase
MNKTDFQKLLSEKILVLDGATGTELQKRGLPTGVCPEQWVLDNPESILAAQSEYRQAGSDAVYSCTFGGNRLKLEEFGLGDRVVEINRELARLSRRAVGDGGLVAGDMGPTGHFVQPFGDLPFEEAVQIFKEQVKGLLEGGVDFFVIETMMDIQEARAALLAVRESCELPVCVSMTFDESGRTLTGTDPATAVVTLQSLGADAVGCNCSTGPEDMVKVIAAMQEYAEVPLIAKPNAGLPKLVGGKTVFDMAPEEFGRRTRTLAEQGVNLIGGCCGTAPAYIRELRKNLPGVCVPSWGVKSDSVLSSARATVRVGRGLPVAVVGERINPTGKKKLKAELLEGRLAEVRRFALEQVEAGAALLDVNVGMPGIDEKDMMTRVVELLVPMVELPLCLDSSTPEVIEQALRLYPGRALINSISGERAKLEKLLPIAAKYGAMFILLPLDDQGIPATAEERTKVIETVFGEARKLGYAKKDIVVDGLVMTVSSDQRAAAETLKVVEWCSDTFGCGTILGLSNVSFGLPERKWVNTAFLTMAIGRGLTMAIANPSSDMLMNIKLACDVLTVNDPNSRAYIEHFANAGASPVLASKPVEELSIGDQIFEAVVKGDKESIVGRLTTALAAGEKPSDLVDQFLIPAITKVGEFFELKKYFLPQLIMSAETMKTAFAYLEPLLAADASEDSQAKARVVIATVKGDIHDIGKNIVGLMLKNYGFEVHDLGKDVEARTIIDRAREVKAHIVCLSALMTTTMVEMRTVIELAKAERLASKFMVGGAVVDAAYAEEIGADGYSQDAYAAVKLAQRLTAER